MVADPKLIKEIVTDEYFKALAREALRQASLDNPDVLKSIVSRSEEHKS